MRDWRRRPHRLRQPGRGPCLRSRSPRTRGRRCHRPSPSRRPRGTGSPSRGGGRPPGHVPGRRGKGGPRKGRLAPHGDRGHQPAGKPGSGRCSRQRPRRHRTGRGGCPVGRACVPRRTHRTPQPCPTPRPPPRCPSPGSPPRSDGGSAVPGPRPLQGSQRLPRPRSG